MKRILLAIVFLVFTITVFSQARIGYTEYQIRSDFSDYYFVSNYLSDGAKYITMSNYYGADVSYLFDSLGICTLTFVSPYDNDALNTYAKLYSDNYTQVSDTEWKIYTENGILTVKLLIGVGKPSFIIYAEK